MSDLIGNSEGRFCQDMAHYKLNFSIQKICYECSLNPLAEANFECLLPLYPVKLWLLEFRVLGSGLTDFVLRNTCTTKGKMSSVLVLVHDGGKKHQ